MSFRKRIAPPQPVSMRNQFTVRIIREAVEFPSLEVFKPGWMKTDATWSEFSFNLYFEQETGPDTSWGPFQPE